MKLADASRLFKQSILVFIGLMVLYFILRISLITGTFMIKVLFPPKPPVPTMQFGLIPLPSIDSLKTDGNIEYKLDTISGRLPSGLPSQMPVFKVIIPKRDIFAEQKAKQIAEYFGFKNSAYAEISNIEWKWQNLVPQRSLNLNILTFNYVIDPNLTQLNLYLKRGDAINPEQAKTTALNILANHTFVDFKRDEKKLMTEITFARINQEVLEEAPSLSEAQLTKVDVYRTIDYSNSQFKIYGIKYDFSYINYYLAQGYTSPNQILKANVAYWDFDPEKGSTYPLKNINTAWNEINAGNGTIVKLTEEGEDIYKPYIQKNIKTVKIKSVELAYIIDKDLPKFIQPIYIFKGQFETQSGVLGQYISYLPALDNAVVK